MEKLWKRGNTVCDDHTKKRGCRGERCEVISGITIQSKLKIKGQDPVGNYPNPEKSTWKASRVMHEKSQSLSLFPVPLKRHQGEVGWSSSGDPSCTKQPAGLQRDTRENPRGARPLTPAPAPAAGGAPSWPRAHCVPRLTLGFQSRGRQRQDPLSRAFTKPERWSPSKQQTKSDPRASALCCCTGSSPGIT